MRFDAISLFPEVIESYCNASILGRAIENNNIQLFTHQLKNYGLGKHKRVDDIPYGGGTGMILKPEPIFEAHNNIPKLSQEKTKTIVFTPRGQTLSQPFIRNELASQEQLILICGRYEGIDERVMQLADYQISLGNYILTGGELASMIIIDSVSRLVDGVLPKGTDVTGQDSFSDEQGVSLEAPQYTRPQEYNNLSVPDVLLSGNHQEIQKWRESFGNSPKI